MRATVLGSPTGVDNLARVALVTTVGRKQPTRTRCRRSLDRTTEPAVAPADFGAFAGALLVANAGDGHRASGGRHGLLRRIGARRRPELFSRRCGFATSSK